MKSPEYAIQRRACHKMICRVVLLAFISLSFGMNVDAELIPMGQRREVFVDAFMIDSIQGIAFKQKDPVDLGPVMAFDQAWEGAFCGYATILKDDDRYRLYYRGLPDAGKDGSPAEVTCYAESTDGIQWLKPELNLFPLSDFPVNNIILADHAPASHNFSPFKDTRAGVPEGHRYKALGGIASSGLIAFVSPDGIHWSRLQDQPVFRPEGWVLDSQNVAFWSEAESFYILYYRSSVDGLRSVARAVSEDFIHWQPQGQMTYTDTDTARPSHHLYTNQTQPYFRAPHIYLATAARFMPGRKVLTEEQANAIQVHPKYFNDTSDSVLMSSRGGLLYDRTFTSALIRPGIGARNWVSRSNYPVLGLVQTGEFEMSLYLNQDYGQPTSHLHRYGFRLDGLTCLSADAEGGFWISKPLTWSGNRLYMNFATSAAGSIRVELLHADGVPVAGYDMAESEALIGNEIERVYRWRQGAEMRLNPAHPIRLKMHMVDAELYSLRFGL